MGKERMSWGGSAAQAVADTSEKIFPWTVLAAWYTTCEAALIYVLDIPLQQPSIPKLQRWSILTSLNLEVQHKTFVLIYHS